MHLWPVKWQLKLFHLCEDLSGCTLFGKVLQCEFKKKTVYPFSTCFMRTDWRTVKDFDRLSGRFWTHRYWVLCPDLWPALKRVEEPCQLAPGGWNSRQEITYLYHQKCRTSEPVRTWLWPSLQQIIYSMWSKSEFPAGSSYFSSCRYRCCSFNGNNNLQKAAHLRAKA
jgi:hypothetical protein